MNIGLLTSIGPTLDAFFEEIAQAWTENGHRVFPAAGTPTKLQHATILDDITRRPSARNLRAPGKIAAWVRENHIDLLVTNTATASTLARVRRLPVPVVYFCHGLHWNGEPRGKARIWQATENALLRNTAGVITLNQDDAMWFANRIAPDRLLRLKGGVGVPLQRYPRSPLPQQQCIQLLWIGEFSKRKRPDLIIEVANMLAHDQLNFNLVMLGQGPLYDEIKQIVCNLGLQKYVELPGRQPVQEHIKASHLLVHTALWEGLPRVLLEGYAMGRRAVAFDVKGSKDIPEIIPVTNGDTASFAKVIHQLAAEPDTLSPSSSADWLDVHKVAEQLSSFFDYVIEKQGLASRDPLKP